MVKEKMKFLSVDAGYVTFKNIFICLTFTMNTYMLKIQNKSKINKVNKTNLLRNNTLT